jgi:hypothetical protein
MSAKSPLHNRAIGMNRMMTLFAAVQWSQVALNGQTNRARVWPLLGAKADNDRFWSGMVCRLLTQRWGNRPALFG